MPRRTSEWFRVQRNVRRNGSKTMGGTTAVNSVLWVSPDQVVSIAPQPARALNMRHLYLSCHLERRERTRMRVRSHSRKTCCCPHYLRRCPDAFCWWPGKTDLSTS